MPIGRSHCQAEFETNRSHNGKETDKNCWREKDIAFSIIQELENEPDNQ